MRSARRADSSLGSESASSRLFVWSDCVPPRIAAIAWTAVRTTLTSICCAVSVLPAVCVWKRSIQLLRILAPNSSRIIRAQSRRAARNFATSSKRWLCALKKKERRGAKASTSSPRADRRRDVGAGVGEGEGQLLHGRRARLADVVAADRDRVPAGKVLRAVLEAVGREAQRRAREGR